ncbi:hypothetical protein G3I59_32250 [Amycolatopsis rubida]|uniref:Flp pilus-assembly TadE/G-like n=1 Tax=Amycolatopsis rubida TaxID=112413 RepID=A0ABX0BRH5_9PSEU|nr:MULTISPECIES: hypothetical protein [Amycolatopsis]MYW90487.1 hypothetical protein [Amycolatopsis rubida]MYW95145.1 hypothetical protein [Amycolatopsis rubida]NEC55466.1 hypothetical protein [Amycolatopsis rubida]NEC60133.1 hypothetical protein [Amycolatopsis rubida]OAP25019.1 hypothetical protein A4R44_04088 [Amycolatopsis sp. M39]
MFGTLPVRLRRLRADEDGRVTAFVVVLVTAIIAFSGLVLDGGLALAGKIRAIGEAQEAARAGAQAIDLSTYRSVGALRLVPRQATILARQYLAAAGDSGTVSVADNTVTVTVTVSQSTQLLGFVGIGSITVTGTGKAQPQRGISGEDRGLVNTEGISGSNGNTGGNGFAP